MQTLAFDRSIDQLEQNLLNLAHRRNELEYEFLKAVQEFDIRQGWRLWHLNNCAEWLNLKCGIAPGTAREKVRVARALFDLPKCSAAFAAGDLSYSKVRSLTRIATRETERDLVEYALGATASQVQDCCQRLRNGSDVSVTDANRVHKARWFSFSHDDQGMMSLTATLPRETGELLVKAVELAASRLEEDHGEIADSDGFFARQADALVELARAYLSKGANKPGSSADHYQVLVHVDDSALRRKGGKSDLPVESVRRLTCDASLVEVSKDAEGNPLDLGRKKRVVSRQLKRALLARDKHCSYPGCSHTRWLDAHHVMHWADGGDTSLDNCLLLCSKHHRLLHEGGYSIETNYKGERYFKSVNGKCIVESSRDDCAGEYSVRENPRHYAVGNVANRARYVGGERLR